MKEQAFELRLDLALYERRRIENRRSDIFNHPLEPAKTLCGRAVYLVRLVRAKIEIIRAAFHHARINERWLYIFDYGAPHRERPQLRYRKRKGYEIFRKSKGKKHQRRRKPIHLRKTERKKWNWLQKKQ